MKRPSNLEIIEFYMSFSIAPYSVMHDGNITNILSMETKEVIFVKGAVERTKIVMLLFC